MESFLALYRQKKLTPGAKEETLVGEASSETERWEKYGNGGEGERKNPKKRGNVLAHELKARECLQPKKQLFRNHARTHPYIALRHSVSLRTRVVIQCTVLTLTQRQQQQHRREMFD